MKQGSSFSQLLFPRGGGSKQVGAAGNDGCAHDLFMHPSPIRTAERAIMQFRYSALIAVWTMLSGPVFS